MEIIKVATENDVIDKLCSLVEQKANEAISESSVFRIGLSGGSLIKYLSSGLPKITTDWSKWQLFFCDERFVKESDPDSTFGCYKSQLIPNTKLTESQFFKINGDVSLEDCAKDYEARIKEVFKSDSPVFDVLLLGMGPDGHTCSLFPNHKLLTETSLLIAPIDDSPKPPPKRVTMTYPLINNAKCCLFAMAGAGKADMIDRILVKKEGLPAGLVKPAPGKLIWIVDLAAGKFLE